MVQLAQLDLQDSPAQPDHKDQEEATDPRVSLVQLALMDHLDHKDPLAHQDQLVPRVCQDLKDPREMQAVREAVDHRVFRGNVVSVDLMVLQEALVPQDLQDVMAA